MAAKENKSNISTIVQLFSDLFYIIYSVIRSTLFFATLPITQRLCSRCTGSIGNFIVVNCFPTVFSFAKSSILCYDRL